MNFGSTVTTDVMPLIRYAGVVALAKHYGDGPAFVDRINAHLTRLSHALTLDDVYSLLVSGQTLAEEMIQTQVDKLAKGLADPTESPDGIAAIKKFLYEKQRILDGYRAFRSRLKNPRREISRKLRFPAKTEVCSPR